MTEPLSPCRPGPTARAVRLLMTSTPFCAPCYPWHSFWVGRRVPQGLKNSTAEGEAHGASCSLRVLRHQCFPNPSLVQRRGVLPPHGEIQKREKDLSCTARNEPSGKEMS